MDHLKALSRDGAVDSAPQASTLSNQKRSGAQAPQAAARRARHKSNRDKLVHQAGCRHYHLRSTLLKRSSHLHIKACAVVPAFCGALESTYIHSPLILCIQPPNSPQFWRAGLIFLSQFPHHGTGHSFTEAEHRSVRSSDGLHRCSCSQGMSIFWALIDIRLIMYMVVKFLFFI